MGLFGWLPSTGSQTPPPPPGPTIQSPKIDLQTQPAPIPAEQQPLTATATAPLTPFQRISKQATLFLAGSAFLVLTARLANKSVARRYASTFPKYYTTNSQAMKNQVFNGGKDAFEALNIATLGVASFGMIFVGGTMFATDIVSVEEARSYIRSRYGTPGRKTDQEVEEELEEWVATMLARKEKREKKAKEDERV